MTKEFVVLDFMDAWNKHDMDKIMSYMHTDCVFLEARGTEVTGKKHKGYEDVKKAFQNVINNFKDAQWKNPVCIVYENKAYSEWTFEASINQDKKIEVRGVDVFTFKNDKILIKDSYLKSRPTILK
ncbi:hypothetical protein WH52_10940 [Tenacibaculum holothuriorum]|uniref:SnoaL-like domain-containing protein n=1 Tax=Tenacibaculum holothuriorum TaxID=1635173 RepID=A0A1Y2PAD4_9FLAO|nr:nuclear transport factor 2 family protein [Tenacibaculum holothuriorum]OSY87392.1 hypothetical protein WH52_10940 [Tenacibaculum holothuriorum]